MFTRSTPSLWAVAGAPLAPALLAGCGGNDDGGSTVMTPKSCDTAALASLKLDNASVKAAAAVPAGSYTPPGTNTALTDLPAFCRIDAAATPTSDSLINFQVWVPMGSAWNGELVTTGNGGYSPALSYRDMAYAMKQGYAEMQRYPQDFDGVIAGAPGNNRVRLNIEFMHRFMSNRNPGDNSTLIMTPAKAALVTSAAIAACDALDGVTDGVMEDPRACTSAQFNVDALLCQAGDAPTCITAEQVAVARTTYAGPKTLRTGAQLYPGLVVGSESGWPAYWGTTEPVRADFWRLWTYDNPQWNWWTFDFDRDVTFADAKVGYMVDQNNAGLSAFKACSGKAIVYQGWQDPVVNPVDTIAYYDKVKTGQGAPAEIDSFFRLFLVLGMGHCADGAGATNFGNQSAPSPLVDVQHDVLTALDRWVEQGTVADSIVASRVVSGSTVRTRPLCAYPKKAVYKGTGSTDDAANFSCQ
jgi:feruloyl esterase